MSDAPHSPLPKLRTFAIDQAHARGETPVPTSPAPAVTVSEVKKPAVETPPVTKESKPVVKEAPIVVGGSTPQPPAFHELKKVHKDVKATPPLPKKNVTVRNKEKERFATDAVVITANKRGEFKLLPALFESFSNWLKSFSKKNTGHAYTVEAVTMRKGVVQKATTKTGVTFIGSKDSIKQEILKRRESEEHDTDLIWTPNTEAGYALLESPTKPAATTTPVIEYKKRSVPPPQITEPTIVPPPPIAAPEPEPVIPPASWTRPTYTPPPEPVAPPPVRPAPIPVTVPTPPTATTAPVTQPSIPTLSIPRTPNPRSSYLRNGLRSLIRFDTTLTTVVLVGSLVSFVMVFFIVRAFIGIIAPQEQSEVVETKVPPLLSSADSVRSVAISDTSAEALAQALASEPRPGSGVTEFSVTRADGTRLTGTEMWSLFGTNTNPNLARTIKEARLGYGNGEPFLVLDVSDPTTAFGALLSFEPLMPTELPSFLNLGVVNSVSVSDSVINGSDIRVFTDDGEEVLVYGFIGKNIIVITGSREAFKATLGAGE